MSTKLRWTAQSLLIATLIAFSTPTQATVLDPVTLDDLAEQAELIFEGLVVDVEYGMSDPDPAGQGPLPHTFVTFGIEKTIKGASARGGQITLRFLGGPAGDGRVLLVPGMPLFDVGDRDVLFVRGNGAELAPLVGWNQGRFRNVRGALYSDEGQELHVTPDGRLDRGKLQPLAEATRNRIGERELVLVHGGDEVPGENEWSSAEAAEPSPRLDAARFLSIVAAKVKAAKGRGAAVVPSADVRDRFVAPALGPVRRSDARAR